MSVIAVNDRNFETEVLRAQLPVLVDFYADWCQPCKQMEPVLAELAVELEGKLTVAKLDIEASPGVAQAFRVQSIPMLVLVHQGQLVGHHMGVLDKRALLEMVKPVLPASASEVTPQELAQLLSGGRALPVDVRDAASFGRYRIPGAVHVPADELATRKTDLAARDGRIRVLYGRSGDQTKELAEGLQSQGLEIAFLAGGFLHWEAEGLEVERG